LPVYSTWISCKTSHESVALIFSIASLFNIFNCSCISIPPKLSLFKTKSKSLSLKRDEAYIRGTTLVDVYTYIQLNVCLTDSFPVMITKKLGLHNNSKSEG